MRRNRESAAQSRNRKKQYVEELESQVKTLEEQVTALHQENVDLRREHARLLGQPFPELRPPGLSMGLSPHATGSDTTTAAVIGEDNGHPEACTVSSAATSIAPPSQAVRKPSVGATDALLGLELLSRSASCAGLPEVPMDKACASHIAATAAHARAASHAAVHAAAHVPADGMLNSAHFDPASAMPVQSQPIAFATMGEGG